MDLTECGCILVLLKGILGFSMEAAKPYFNVCVRKLFGEVEAGWAVKIKVGSDGYHVRITRP